MNRQLRTVEKRAEGRMTQQMKDKGFTVSVKRSKSSSHISVVVLGPNGKVVPGARTTLASTGGRNADRMYDRWLKTIFESVGQQIA